MRNPGALLAVVATLGALLALLHVACAERALRALRPERDLLLSAKHLAWARGLGAGLKSDDICESKPATCAGDCSRERVLCQQIPTLNVWINTQNETCPKGQYCSDGNCTATAPESCTAPSPPKPSTAFECSGEGYFPDVTSCTKYFFCTAEFEAYPFDCSEYPGTVYDQRSTRCVPAAQGPACTKLSCSNLAVRVQVYAADPRLYALCRSRDAAQAIIVRCPGDKVMNVAANSCENGCVSAGRYKPDDAADDKTYIECVALSGNKLSAPTRRQCPGASKFDGSLGQCVAAADASTTPSP